MPKLCPKMMASMGLSLVPVAPQGSWYEPSKVPTLVFLFNHPSHIKHSQFTSKVCQHVDKHGGFHTTTDGVCRWYLELKRARRFFSTEHKGVGPLPDHPKSSWTVFGFSTPSDTLSLGPYFFQGAPHRGASFYQLSEAPHCEFTPKSPSN